MKCDDCGTRIDVSEHYIQYQADNICEDCFMILAIDRLGGKLMQRVDDNNNTVVYYKGE